MTAPTEDPRIAEQRAIIARQTVQYPGFTAGNALVWGEHDKEWKNLREFRNSEGNEFTDAQKMIHALHQFELRQRSFLHGAVMWITIGAPIIWGIVTVFLLWVLRTATTS